MKVLITTNQINGLIKGGVNPVELYLKIFHPKIRKRTHSSMSKGDGWIYYDANTKEKLFKYSQNGPVINRGNGLENFHPNRLYVDNKLYYTLSSTINDVDEYIERWFNDRYGLNFEVLYNSLY